MSRVDEKLTSSNRAATTDASDHDRDLAGVVVGEAGHNGIVSVVVGCLLLRAINQPIRSARGTAVGNPETGDIRIVCEMETQRFGQTQRPGIIEGADEDSWSVAQVAQRSRSFALETV